MKAPSMAACIVIQCGVVVKRALMPHGERGPVSDGGMCKPALADHPGPIPATARILIRSRRTSPPHGPPAPELPGQHPIRTPRQPAARRTSSRRIRTFPSACLFDARTRLTAPATSAADAKQPARPGRQLPLVTLIGRTHLPWVMPAWRRAATVVPGGSAGW
jgi:hypothetical protein